MKSIGFMKEKFVFQHIFDSTGVLIHFVEVRTGKRMKLPVASSEIMELAKWEPEVVDALTLINRLINQFVALDIPEEVIVRNKDLFSEEELREKPLLYKNDGILFPYKTIAAIRFAEATENFGLSDEHLSYFGIPSYASLRIDLSAVSNYTRSDFRIEWKIRDKDGETVRPVSFVGHTIATKDEQPIFLTPSVARLISRLHAHAEVINQVDYENNINVRAKELSDIRQLAIRASATLDKFLKTENIIFLEQLPYVIGRGVNDEVVLSPALPVEHSNFDIKFQEELSGYSKEKPPQLNLSIDKKSRERKRVFFGQKAWSQCLKIKEYNSHGQEKLEEIITSPEEFFDGQPPREKLAATFSSRVVGFIFGKVKSEGAERGSKTDWVEGIEDQSTILRTCTGAAIPISYKPAPEVYARIKERTLDFKDQLEEDETSQREEAGLFLTPLPPGEDKKILIEEFGAEFNLRDLENFVRRVEYENRPKLTEDEFERARAAVKEADSRAELLLDWTLEENGEKDQVRIPVKSLRDALPKATPKVDDRVSLKIAEDRKSRLGGPPEWDWKTCDLALLEKPSGLRNASLLMHQRRGFAWLKWLFEHELSNSTEFSHRGALLADDMGLGKTIQVIALIAHVKLLEEMKEKPILIVSPLGLIRSSWIKDGFKKFVDTELLGYDKLIDKFRFVRNYSECPHYFDRIRLKQEAIGVHEEMAATGKPFHECSISTEVKEYLGKIQSWCKGNIVITSYETMRLNSLTLGCVDFALVILDEAQKIKNAGALQSSSAKALKAEMCIAMSGTPIENSLMDLWNIMDFVLPGYLPAKDEFRKTFVIPTKILPPGSPKRAELRKRLETALEPIWMRRTKKEVLKGSRALPPMTHYDEVKSTDGQIKNTHLVPMSAEQETVYQEYSAHFQHAQGGHRLAALQGMLRACSCPWLASNIKAQYSNKSALYRLSPKLEVTMKILDQIKRGSEEDGRKVLIFANIIHLMNSLAWFIADWHRTEFGQVLEVEVYNGELQAKAREHVLNRFEKAIGFQVLILSPKAGGTGLNLTCANHVIHYTREWNPAVERQATDRVYRIGQNRNVHVYYPTTGSKTGDAPSAEEHLANLLRSKRELMDDFTISPADLALTEEDLAPSVEQKKTVDVRVLANHLPILSPQQFEGIVALVFERMGYETFVVGKTGDFGADIVCLGKDNNLLIQAKHAVKGGTSGTKAIIEVRGARSTYEANWKVRFQLVAATSTRFNEEAHNLAANGDSVKLIEKGLLKEMLDKHSVTQSDIEQKLQQKARAA